MRSHRESLSKNKTTAVSAVTVVTTANTTQTQNNKTSSSSTINANNKSKINKNNKNTNKTDDTNVEKIFQEEDDTKIKSNKCKFVKSCKPLVNHKFYLDIEKHNIFVKIETKIRELGGSIEFFLTKDITHFITDKKDTLNNCFVAQQQDKSPATTPATTSTVRTPQTPLTPNYLSPIATRTTPSSNDLKTNSRIKTRADVMLHRARKGTCEISDNNKKTLSTLLNSANKTESISSIITKNNPLQIAESWGTLIWHTEYAIKFLEKVNAYVKERYPNNTADYTKSPIVDSLHNHHPHHHHRTKSAQVFKGNYIKIESSQKGYYRPYYKIFNSKWPVLNLKPHKKGVFPLTAVDENYIYNSDTKTIGKQKSKATTALVTSAVAAAADTKPISNRTRKSSVIDVKMTRKNRSTSKHIRVKTVGTTGTTNTTATTATTTTATSNKQNISSEKQCGYCEICRVEYDALTIHLKSESHQNFVKNENNFLALDTLIKSSANMDKFLSLNSKTTITMATAANLQQTVNTTPANNASKFDINSITKRTSKRISNNGSQLKPTLPPLPAPPPSPPPPPNPSNNSPNPPNSISHAPQLMTGIMKCKSSPRKEQQQIEILEKTTTLGHTRQTRQQSGFVSNQTLKLSVLCNDDHESSINVMRARRQSVKKINYAEPKEDEENSVEDLIIGYNRNQRKKLSKPKTKEKPKSGTKERKNSSESEMKPLPLPLPISLLYKVVEPSDKKTTKSNLKKDNSAKENPLVNGKNSKKQKTGKEKQKKLQLTLKEEQEEEEEESKQKSPIIVKIRKVRQSELSILSGEAVNFMFPKRRSFSSDPTDIDRQTTSESGRGGTSSSIICSSSSNADFNRTEEFKLADRTITLKRKQSNPLNLESSGVDSELKLTNNKRRRLNNDENEEKSDPNRTVVKIEEEAENYSNIRTSSPKLSLQRNVPVRTYERRRASKKKLNQGAVKKLIKTEGNTAADGTSSTAALDNEAKTNKSKMPKTPSLNDIINEKLFKYKFAFERIPNSELWYQVFHRQDEGYEKTFEYYGSTVYRKLPYEMGPLPPSKKPLCALCHISSSKATENDSANTITASTSSNSNTNKLVAVNKCPEPKPMKRDKYSSSDEENNSKIEPNLAMDTISSVVKKHGGKSSICNRAAALLNSEMPRKSPREHASTLAILSCIIQRRQQQQRKKNLSSSSSLIQIKKEFDPDNRAYSSQTEVNNQICTQISENVKRLRRGAEKETIPIAATTISTSSTTTANNLTTRIEHLLKAKKPIPKKPKMIKKKLHPSSKLISSSSRRKGKLQYDIDEYRMNKHLKDNKHVNVVKLEKDIDEYLMSSVPFNCDDDQNNLLAASALMDCDDNAANGNDDKFVKFSKDIDLKDLLGEQQQYSGKDSRKGGFFGFNATSKKRKNKTGWPTAKRRTATRQHTKQQQQQQLQQKQQAQEEKEQQLQQQLQSQVQQIGSSGSNSNSSSGRKKTEDDAKFAVAIKSEPSTSGIATLTTTTTTNSSTIVANTTSSTYKCQKSDSDINNISTNSPITPPESDNDDDMNGNDDNDDNEDDDDEEECTERNDCDDTVSNSTITITDYKNSTTINCHLPSPQHISNQHNHQNFQNLSHNHNHHQNQNQSQNLNNSLGTISDKTDVVSDIFTVSSDSLDTVLDVGSQIKSEDQEEIIASSKCNGTNLNSSSSRQYNNHNHHHHNNHQTITKTLIPSTLSLIANRINDDKDMQMMDNDIEINGDNYGGSSISNGCRHRLSSNASGGKERKISSSSSSLSPATSPLKRLQSLSMSANNKRIKYPNSLKLKAVGATANNSGGNINSINLNLNSSLNLFYDSKSNNSSNNNSSSSINSISFNNSKINAKKLSNLFNNGDRKDMKVVVVVKRERNNSICSNNDSSLIMNNSICSRLSSQPDDILNTKSTSTLTTSAASVIGTSSSSFVETEMIKREQIAMKPERETGTGNKNDDCSGGDGAGIALEESVAMATSTPSTMTTATTNNNLSTISPRRLRKPRGRWYRER